MLTVIIGTKMARHFIFGNHIKQRNKRKLCECERDKNQLL